MELYLPRLSSPNPNLFFSRSVTFTLALLRPSTPPPRQPLSADGDLLAAVTSILSDTGPLDADKSRRTLAALSPDLFHCLFAAAHSRFPFPLPSYSLLLHLLLLLLLDSNVVPPARLLLIRLIDGKEPAAWEGPGRPRLPRRHVEIARAVLDAAAVAVLDLLVHVLCTQFGRRDGMGPACEVFAMCADAGSFPSLKTCNFLLNSLVRSCELDKCVSFFDVMRRRSMADVYSFSAAINSLCKGGKVAEANELYAAMEVLRVKPNVVVYNTLIDGFCKAGDLDKALSLKEEMVRFGLVPSRITYSILINCFVKLERIDDAKRVVDEMSLKGIMPNEVIYNTLIDGYCKTGNFVEVRRIQEEMVSKGIEPSSVTYNSIIQGLCKMGQMGEAELLMEEMLFRGITVNPASFNSIIYGHCVSSSLDTAVHLFNEMILWNLRPNDAVLTTLVSKLCKCGD